MALLRVGGSRCCADGVARREEEGNCSRDGFYSSDFLHWLDILVVSSVPKRLFSPLAGGFGRVGGVQAVISPIGWIFWASKGYAEGYFYPVGGRNWLLIGP